MNLRSRVGVLLVVARVSQTLSWFNSPDKYNFCWCSHLRRHHITPFDCNPWIILNGSYFEALRVDYFLEKLCWSGTSTFLIGHLCSVWILKYNEWRKIDRKKLLENLRWDFESLKRTNPKKQWESYLACSVDSDSFTAPETLLIKNCILHYAVGVAIKKRELWKDPGMMALYSIRVVRSVIQRSKWNLKHPNRSMPRWNPDHRIAERMARMMHSSVQPSTIIPQSVMKRVPF